MTQKATVATLDELLGVIKALMSNSETNVFRGQADADWKLIASLPRELRELGCTNNRKGSKFEDTLLKRFKHDAHLFIPEPQYSTLDSPTEWWGIMQHHGAPTRMLDWSYSPFVAAFFAAVDCQSKDGAIWCLSRDLVKQTNKDMSIPEKNLIYLFEDNYRSARMAAQQGLFTSSGNILKNQEKQLVRRYPTNTLVKLLIPKDSKRQMVDELRAMNISSQSLFPDLDGLAKSIKDCCRSTKTSFEKLMHMSTIK